MIAVVLSSITARATRAPASCSPSSRSPSPTRRTHTSRSWASSGRSKVELAFYLLVPLVFLAVWRATRTAPTRAARRRAMYALAAGWRGGRASCSRSSRPARRRAAVASLGADRVHGRARARGGAGRPAGRRASSGGARTGSPRRRSAAGSSSPSWPARSARRPRGSRPARDACRSPGSCARRSSSRSAAAAPGAGSTTPCCAGSARARTRSTSGTSWRCPSCTPLVRGMEGYRVAFVLLLPLVLIASALLAELSWRLVERPGAPAGDGAAPPRAPVADAPRRRGPRRSTRAMTRHATAPAPRRPAGLLAPDPWQMTLGERAALEGLLARLRPALAVEIGTAEGGSTRCLGAPRGRDPPRSTRCIQRGSPRAAA